MVGSLEDALANSRADPEAWVIGGAQIYVLALPEASRCEVTEVDVGHDEPSRLPRLTNSGVRRAISISTKLLIALALCERQGVPTSRHAGSRPCAARCWPSRLSRSR